MKADLQAILRYRPFILKALENFIKQQKQPASTGLPWGEDVTNRLLTFATTGKLLRGSLVCYSYALWGGESLPPATVLDTAVALELAHASFLIHDDIIDQDDLRRGQPALHRQYSQLFDLPEPARSHLGEGLALCAGDMTFLMAFELLGAIPPNPDGSSLGPLLARELSIVCAGQMQDVYLAAATKPPSKSAIYRVMRAKSAGYSVAWPLRAGAILADQPAVVQRHMYALGIAVGTLFQIRDDELGIFGTAAKLGKPVDSDIREGKKTLLYYYLWRAATAPERRQLRMIFGNAEASSDDIVTVRRLLRHYRVGARLQEDIDRLKRDATRQIYQLKIPLSGQQELHQLVEFCAQREA